MRIPKRGIVAGVALAATAALLTGCSNGAQSDPNTLKLWHFEGTDSDVGIAWAKAIEIFEEETGATVEYEDKSFEQIRSTASQVLNSSEAPDVFESPKGNATAGLLASQGLLADITDAVEEYGWDDKLAPSLQTTAKYDENGIMGSGPWYGVPNYGEYVTVYYNKTAFDELGLSVPTTYDEFEDVLDAFVAAGQTPIAEAGAEYPLGQLFYQLALTQADRQFVNDYQLYENPVDWQGEALTYAAEKIVEYVDKGWISADSTGLKAEDMGVGFMSGEYPIMVSGSGGPVASSTRRRRSSGTRSSSPAPTSFPDPRATSGSSPRTRPTRSSRTSSSTSRCVPRSRPSSATTARSRSRPTLPTSPTRSRPKLITDFNTVVEQDGLAFYPDWPTPNFYDQLVGALQELVNGTLTPEQTLEQLGVDYEDGVADIIG